MKLIDKIRLITKNKIKRKMKLEYRNSIKKIKNSARKGHNETIFFIENYYENEDDIHMYIIDKLKSKGFKVEGKENRSHGKFINIYW